MDFESSIKSKSQIWIYADYILLMVRLRTATNLEVLKRQLYFSGGLCIMTHEGPYSDTFIMNSPSLGLLAFNETIWEINYKQAQAGYQHVSPNKHQFSEWRKIYSQNMFSLNLCTTIHLFFRMKHKSPV